MLFVATQQSSNGINYSDWPTPRLSSASRKLPPRTWALFSNSIIQFSARFCFFTFLLQGSDTGQMFGELFQLLVRLSNECEAGGEWVIGAPLMELPLSEQIVVLHRLDHSVHTARLWIVQEAKIIAHTWELDVFFLLVKGDIVNCLEELSYLKVKRREFTFFPPPSFKIILKNPLVPACRSRQRIIDRFCERPGIRLRENEGKNCIRGERERGSAPGMLRFCSLFGKKWKEK